MSKVAIVTGGNAGIGLQTVVSLARKGFRVGVVCRSEKKGLYTRAYVQGEVPDAVVDVFVADLSVQADIRRAADQILEAYPSIQVLVNNAGAFYTSGRLNADGVERTFAVNHLAPFMLTLLLLDRLIASAPARIVVVSSGSHYQAKPDWGDVHYRRRRYDGMAAYAQSKLANVLFTKALARRLQGENVTVNALHPGVVSTSIAQKNARWGIYKLGWMLIRPFMISPKKGAETSLYLATSPEVEGVTGGYFYKKKRKKPSKLSFDEQLGEELWALSEKLAGVSYDG